MDAAQLEMSVAAMRAEIAAADEADAEFELSLEPSRKRLAAYEEAVRTRPIRRLLGFLAIMILISSVGIAWHLVRITHRDVVGQAKEAHEVKMKDIRWFVLNMTRVVEESVKCERKPEGCDQDFLAEMVTGFERYHAETRMNGSPVSQPDPEKQRDRVMHYANWIMGHMMHITNVKDETNLIKKMYDHAYAGTMDEFRTELERGMTVTTEAMLDEMSNYFVKRFFDVPLTTHVCNGLASVLYAPLMMVCHVDVLTHGLAAKATTHPEYFGNGIDAKLHAMWLDTINGVHLLSMSLEAGFRFVGRLVTSVDEPWRIRWWHWLGAPSMMPLFLPIVPLFLLEARLWNAWTLLLKLLRLGRKCYAKLETLEGGGSGENVAQPRWWQLMPRVRFGWTWLTVVQSAFETYLIGSIQLTKIALTLTFFFQVAMELVYMGALWLRQMHVLMTFVPFVTVAILIAIDHRRLRSVVIDDDDNVRKTTSLVSVVCMATVALVCLAVGLFCTETAQQHAEMLHHMIAINPQMDRLVIGMMVIVVLTQHMCSTRELTVFGFNVCGLGVYYATTIFMGFGYMPNCLALMISHSVSTS
jgi:hypothetical protein